MPMDFPNMESLKSAARVHKFRQPFEAETEAQFRSALADHVRCIDFVESEEIRNGIGWDRFSQSQHAGLLLRALLGKDGVLLGKGA